MLLVGEEFNRVLLLSTVSCLEFVPYVLQILGFLIESHPAGATSLPEPYRVLFQSILVPAFWDRSGNIPALTRLLQAYIEKAGESIVLEKIVSHDLFLFFSIGILLFASARQLFLESFNVLYPNRKFTITKASPYSIL